MGGSSLLMKICSVICKQSQTAKELKKMRTSVTSSHRSLIESAINRAFDSGEPISSRDESAQKSLLESIKVPWDPENSGKYMYLYIRKKEKDEFVEFVGSESVTNIAMHLIQVLPPLLTELWKLGDIAKVLGVFFAAVTTILEGTSQYDQASDSQSLEDDDDDENDDYKKKNNKKKTTFKSSSKSKTKAEMYDSVIDAIESGITAIFDSFFPIVHAMSKKSPSGPMSIQNTLDWLLRECASDGEGLFYYPNTKMRGIFDILKLEAIDKLIATVHKSGLGIKMWEEVDKVKQGIEKSGLNDSDWGPPLFNSLLSNYGVAFFKEQLMQMCGEEELSRDGLDKFMGPLRDYGRKKK